MKKYVIALDAGTTSSRAMLIDRAGRPVASVQRPFPQIYPQPGWVEHDPQDILSSQLGALTELIMSSNVDTAEIDSIGITNQRETTIVWDRATGEPIMNAIVWQCRRTAPMVEAIASDPATAAEITARTGLVPDAYFSASKLAWILGGTLLRHRGQLAHLEAHRRGRARHGCDQRQPHHALQHPREALGSLPA